MLNLHDLRAATVSSYTNKKFIRKQITKPICDFQLSLEGGGQHTLEFATLFSAPKYYFRFISLDGYTLFLPLVYLRLVIKKLSNNEMFPFI